MSCNIVVHIKTQLLIEKNLNEPNFPHERRHLPNVQLIDMHATNY